MGSKDLEKRIYKAIISLNKEDVPTLCDVLENDIAKVYECLHQLKKRGLFNSWNGMYWVTA